MNLCMRGIELGPRSSLVVFSVGLLGSSRVKNVYFIKRSLRLYCVILLFLCVWHVLSFLFIILYFRPVVELNCFAGESAGWEEDKPDVEALSGTRFVYNPHISLGFEQQRQRLPIFHRRDHILYLLEEFQTLVLVGDTGCGKSTQIPQVSVKYKVAAKKVDHEIIKPFSRISRPYIIVRQY